MLIRAIQIRIFIILGKDTGNRLQFVVVSYSIPDVNILDFQTADVKTSLKGTTFIFSIFIGSSLSGLATSLVITKHINSKVRLPIETELVD